MATYIIEMDALSTRLHNKSFSNTRQSLLCFNMLNGSASKPPDWKTSIGTDRFGIEFVDYLSRANPIWDE